MALDSVYTADVIPLMGSAPPPPPPPALRRLLSQEEEGHGALFRKGD